MLAYILLTLIISTALNMIFIVAQFTILLPAVAANGLPYIPFVEFFVFILSLIVEYYVNYALPKWFYKSSDTLKDYKNQVKYSGLVLVILNILSVSMLVLYMVKSKPILLGLSNSIFMSMPLFYTFLSFKNKIAFAIIFIILAGIENTVKYTALERSFSIITGTKRPYEKVSQKIKNSFVKLKYKFRALAQKENNNGNIKLMTLAILIINGLVSFISYFICSFIVSFKVFFDYDFPKVIIIIVSISVVVMMILTNFIVPIVMASLNSYLDDFSNRRKLVKNCFICFNILSLIMVVTAYFVGAPGYFISNHIHALMTLHNEYLTNALESHPIFEFENFELSRLLSYGVLFLISFIENAIKTITIKLAIRK